MKKGEGWKFAESAEKELPADGTPEELRYKLDLKV